MTDTYRVVAPYVMVKVRTVNGVEVKGLYAPSLLPEGTLPESIEHHLRKMYQGRPMIEKVGGPAPAPAPPSPALIEVTPPTPVPVPAAPAPAPGPGAVVTAPPTTGPGSGKAAWVEYAVGLSYGRADVEAMSRDEIIALTEEGSSGG